MVRKGSKTPIFWLCGAIAMRADMKKSAPEDADSILFAHSTVCFRLYAKGRAAELGCLHARQEAFNAGLQIRGLMAKFV